MPRHIDAEKIPYYLDTSEEAPIEGRMIAFKSDIDKIPAADVAPKSEVEKIFEDIEKCMDHDYISSIGVYNGALKLRIAELKKKYTEEKEK